MKRRFKIITLFMAVVCFLLTSVCIAAERAIVPKAGETEEFSFPFMNKIITMGITPESIMKTFARTEQVKPEESENKYSYILSFKINEIENLRFRFKDDRLVSISMDSGSTEGPGKEIEAFNKWLEKTYGKGKKVKSKDKSTSVSHWNIKGSKVIQKSYYGLESGDYNVSFEIKSIK